MKLNRMYVYILILMLISHISENTVHMLSDRTSHRMISDGCVDYL